MPLRPLASIVLLSAVVVSLTPAESSMECALARVHEVTDRAASAVTGVVVDAGEALCQTSHVVRGAVVHRIDRALDGARSKQAERLGLQRWGGQGWVPLPLDQETAARGVVLVHGLDEPGVIWAELAPELAALGHTVYRFGYPNDQHPSRSAESLASALEHLSAAGVQRIDLVGHSMGGLVARDVATRGPAWSLSGWPGMSAGPRICTVIAVGSPALGSPLAPFAPLSEIKEHTLEFIDDPGLTSALGFLVDGRGGSADALTPGSAYLDELNARSWPGDIALTQVAGRVLEPVADATDALAANHRLRATLGEDRLARLQMHAEQAVDAVGDGVVGVESAIAYPWGEIVITSGDHRSLLHRHGAERSIRRWLGAAEPQPFAWEAITARVGCECADPDRTEAE
ncbi:MAG: alpha/beta hydrolase [Planctomycetota bacterium]